MGKASCSVRGQVLFILEMHGLFNFDHFCRNCCNINANSVGPGTEIIKLFSCSTQPSIAEHENLNAQK